MIDTRLLRYFLAVAREENITHAADVVFTTQSNLSKQMAELEQQLGKKLFERGPRRITLTEEGRFFKNRANEILELIERTKNEIQNFADEVSGTVHIGAIETDVMEKIALTVLELKNSNPKITYDFFSGSVAEITERLDRDLLDFALLIAPVDMKKYDYVLLPVKNSFGLLMRKDFPLASEECVSPSDIKDLPVWMAHQQLESNVLSGWLGRDVKSLNIVATFNLITNPAKLIRNGFGAAFTFENLVNNDTLCFRPLSPKVEAEFYLVWKKDAVFTKQAEMFLQKIKEAFGKR